MDIQGFSKQTQNIYTRNGKTDFGGKQKTHFLISVENGMWWKRKLQYFV